MDLEQIRRYKARRRSAGGEYRRYHRTMAHASKADKAAARRAAIERTRGMFAHLAPGESLADELIADRRAEVHAEELQEAEQHRRYGAS